MSLSRVIIELIVPHSVFSKSPKYYLNVYSLSRNESECIFFVLYMSSKNLNSTVICDIEIHSN